MTTMTMTLTSSQFGLEDMEALLWGPSSPMADIADSNLLNPDTDGQQESSLRGPASPLSSSSSSSPHPFYSPPPSPLPVLLDGDKAGPESDLPPLSWMDLPRSDKGDVLDDLDWMAERVDLADLDLDSLMSSPVGEPPGSPEDILTSLCCSSELDSFPICLDPPVVTISEPESVIEPQEVPSSPFSVPEPQEELEIKTEPSSPDPCSAAGDSPPFTLDLGSEVDISESEAKPAAPPVLPQVSNIVLSLSPTRIVFVLAPKNEVASAAAPDVTRRSPPSSPRSRPYPEPKPAPSLVATEAKSTRGALKVPRDKKRKKMEQNKTAATRYRQKKRAEQDALLVEHAQLERRNMELSEKAESMAREIQYLKELMEEVNQTRLRKGLSADL